MQSRFDCETPTGFGNTLRENTMSPDTQATEPSRAEIDAIEQPLVLEFGAPWCGHCQAAQPIVASVLATVGPLRHLQIEDGKGRLLGRSFRVKLWPTLIFLRDGQEMSRLVRPAGEDEVRQALGQIIF